MIVTYGGELRDSTRTFLALNGLTITYGHPPWLQGTSAVSFSDPTHNSSLGLAYTHDTLGRVTSRSSAARPFDRREDRSTPRWCRRGTVSAVAYTSLRQLFTVRNTAVCRSPSPEGDSQGVIDAGSGGRPS
jgi:hypothetical protein